MKSFIFKKNNNNNHSLGSHFFPSSLILPAIRIISRRKLSFRRLLIWCRSADSEPPHAGSLTADTAGHQMISLSPPPLSLSSLPPPRWASHRLSAGSAERWQDSNWWHFVLFKGRGLIKSSPETPPKFPPSLAAVTADKRSYNYRCGRDVLSIWK